MDLDISDLLIDPELGATTFTIQRKGGEFANEGEWVEASTSIPNVVGIIHPANPKETVKFESEGDRPRYFVAIYSPVEIKASDDDELSDVIESDGHSYRVLAVRPWAQYNYWYALAERFAP